MEPVRRTVELQQIPIREFVVLQVYFDDMVRELQLIEVGRSDEGAGQRLADLATFVQHEIAGARNLVHIHALAAEEEGETHFDTGLELLPRSVEDAHRLIDVVEALDEQSRNGVLLTAPAAPVVLDLLRWVVDEIEGQLMYGRSPKPFEP